MTSFSPLAVSAARMTGTASDMLGDIGVTAFLRDYWQKKPLLIRGAIPEFEIALDAEELAGLACEDGVEARLIERHGDRYALEHGPFDAERLARLPKHEWTLLVQDVEKHLPEFATYLDRFSFLPHWRVDDLMISCAANGGGVGPHVDAYDVFLVQAKGRRQWSISEHFDPEIIPGMDVRVLKNFSAEQHWVLEPGDMLYLPPNVAHDGVALGDDCMTWSIGFRAPSLRDMFSDFSEWLHERLPEDAMYADPDLAPWETGTGKISPSAFARMRKLLRAAMSASDHDLDRWFGQFMTEPKPWLRAEPSAETPDARTFAARFNGGDELLRDSRALLAWSPTDTANVLFVNGAAWDVPAAFGEPLETLCMKRRYAHADFDGQPEDDIMALLRRLHADGVLHFASDVSEH